MKNTWEEICSLMNALAGKNITEAEFQVKIVQILEKIGWKREFGEIVEQRNINIGLVPNRSLRPDIIINIERKDYFVIELKRPDATIIERNYEQLFSYMRQLKLRIGLLITDKIHVFYEEENFNVPVEVLNVEYKIDNPDGIKFLELFSRNEYNAQTVIDYCQEHIQKLKIIDLVTSDEYNEKILGFIKTDICKEFDASIVDLAMKNIVLQINNIEDTLVTKFENGNLKPLTTEERDAAEIEKIKRKVPRWFNNPNQINSRILIKALENFVVNGKMNREELREICKNCKIPTFEGNFNQMANYGQNNHAKVFDINGNIVSIWEPVKDFINEIYSIYKNEATLVNQFENGNRQLVTPEEREVNEIEKIKRRVPRWFNNRQQKNFQILIKALDNFDKNGNISCNELRLICNIDSFDLNFRQMYNILAHGHGKVFSLDGDIVSIWELVKDFINDAYRNYQSRQKH